MNSADVTFYSQLTGFIITGLLLIGAHFEGKRNSKKSNPKK